MADKRSDLFLGIDQGSSSTKAVLLDLHGKIHWQTSVPVATAELSGGRVEQDPEELLASVRTVFEQARVFEPRGATAIGFAFQRSGVTAWRKKTGEPVHPLISHRDTRCLSFVESLSSVREKIVSKTSLPLIPAYAASKIKLLQEKFPDFEIRIGTLDSFILSRLSGSDFWSTEDTIAARTLLYDTACHGWDGELCSYFGVDQYRLAPIGPSLARRYEWKGIPVTASIGDQQAALLGHLFRGGKALLNLGTIGSLTVSTGALMPLPGYTSSVLYSETREGAIAYEHLTESDTPMVAPLLSELLRRENLADFAALDRQCSALGASDDSGAPLIAYVPRGTTGTPHWREHIPDFLNRAIGSDRCELQRAVVESIGSFIAKSIIQLIDRGLLSRETPLSVTGGVSNLTYLLHYIAECSGVTLVKTEHHDATAAGAALAAARGHGAAPQPESDQRGTIIEPGTDGAGDGMRRRFTMWREFEQRIFAGDLQGVRLWA